MVFFTAGRSAAALTAAGLGVFAFPCLATISDQSGFAFGVRPLVANTLGVLPTTTLAVLLTLGVLVGSGLTLDTAASGLTFGAGVLASTGVFRTPAPDP